MLEVGQRAKRERKRKKQREGDPITEGGSKLSSQELTILLTPKHRHSVC